LSFSIVSRICAIKASLGTSLRQLLRVAHQQQLLQRLDIVGERIIRAHHARWNHNTRVL
jgi:hypothetical protein